MRPILSRFDWENLMTLYLAGVIAAFSVFMITLFAVSVWTAMKK